MLDLQHKQKLIEAITFFVKNTRNCGLTKLFKLLYWLDYHHFRETGEMVTGLTYNAYERGPVPDTLFRELKSGDGDIASKFRVVGNSTIDSAPLRTIDDDDLTFGSKAGHGVINKPTAIVPIDPYKHRFLSRREQRIADRIAEIFKDVNAKDISEISHGRFGPWQQALKTGGERSVIDFFGKLVPMTKGDYLDELTLRLHAKDLEEDIKALG